MTGRPPTPEANGARQRDRSLAAAFLAAGVLFLLFVALVRFLHAAIPAEFLQYTALTPFPILLLGSLFGSGPPVLLMILLVEFVLKRHSAWRYGLTGAIGTLAYGLVIMFLAKVSGPGTFLLAGVLSAAITGGIYYACKKALSDPGQAPQSIFSCWEKALAFLVVFPFVGAVFGVLPMALGTLEPLYRTYDITAIAVPLLWMPLFLLSEVGLRRVSLRRHALPAALLGALPLGASVYLLLAFFIVGFSYAKFLIPLSLLIGFLSFWLYRRLLRPSSV